MNALATVVAWSAIIAAITSVIAVILGQRSASRARHQEHMAEIQAAYDRGRTNAEEMLGAHLGQVGDMLEQCRKDRDYWRDFVVRRAGRERE